jgi:hypothetical protein
MSDYLGSDICFDTEEFIWRLADLQDSHWHFVFGSATPYIPNLTSRIPVLQQLGRPLCGLRADQICPNP